MTDLPHDGAARAVADVWLRADSAPRVVDDDRGREASSDAAAARENGLEASATPAEEARQPMEAELPAATTQEDASEDPRPPASATSATEEAAPRIEPDGLSPDARTEEEEHDHREQEPEGQEEEEAGHVSIFSEAGKQEKDEEDEEEEEEEEDDDDEEDDEEEADAMMRLQRTLDAPDSLSVAADDGRKIGNVFRDAAGAERRQFVAAEDGKFVACKLCPYTTPAPTVWNSAGRQQFLKKVRRHAGQWETARQHHAARAHLAALQAILAGSGVVFAVPGGTPTKKRPSEAPTQTQLRSTRHRAARHGSDKARAAAASIGRRPGTAANSDDASTTRREFEDDEPAPAPAPSCALLLLPTTPTRRWMKSFRVRGACIYTESKITDVETDFPQLHDLLSLSSFGSLLGGGYLRGWDRSAKATLFQYVVDDAKRVPHPRPDTLWPCARPWI